MVRVSDDRLSFHTNARDEYQHKKNANQWFSVLAKWLNEKVLF
jgi:hypothetical protein